jgi:hypothetical protein
MTDQFLSKLNLDLARRDDRSGDHALGFEVSETDALSEASSLQSLGRWIGVEPKPDRVLPGQ